MLPYHQIQGFYVVVAGLLAYALWRLFLRLGPRSRVAATGAATGGVALAALFLFPAFLDLRDARGFAAIAIVFYVWGFWLPGLGIRAALAGRDRLLAGLLVVPPLVSLWALFVEPNLVVLRRDEVVLRAWPRDAEPFRVVHVSDLQSVGINARERKALEQINALEPDLVVVSGDYMAGPFWDADPGVEAARAFLGGLRARHGVVVVPGHAEGEEHRLRIFAGLPLRVLANAGDTIELGDGRRLYVYGLDVEEPEPRELLADRGPAGGTATLVVSHVPDLSRDLDGLSVDLHLAGHTHGGQVAIPFFGAPLMLSELPRRFARGLHPIGDHLLNVCAGLGMEGNHAPRIRLFCRPEICLLELTGGGEPKR